MTTSPLPDLTFNPEARIQARHIGRDRQPLLIIDDVLKHPDAMVSYAVEHGAFHPPSDRSNYPGLNGELPPNYAPEIARALRPLLAKGFGIPETADISFQGFFGLTTMPPEAQRPLQRIPHADSPNIYRLAIIHYLCRAPYGGTAFFRHLPTGFESVNHRRYDQYRTRAEGELAAAEATGAWTARYEQIDQVDAVFNRLTVYRTTSLHSGTFTDTALTSDPATGRLTANSFIEAVPPQRPQ